MGETPIYKLPWPELPDVADGPEAFQALAVATEKAISVVPTLGVLLDGESFINTIPRGSYKDFINSGSSGKFTMAKAGLFTIDMTCMMVTTNGMYSGGTVDMYIDGNLARGVRWHSLVASGFPTTAGGMVQKWLTAGDHGVTLRVRVDDSGGPLPSASCDYYANAQYY